MKEKERAIKLTEQIKKESKNILNEILLELNKKVGEDVWYHLQNLLQIQFKGNSIKAEFTQEKVEFGDIIYYKPNLESLKFILVHSNPSMYRAYVTDFKSLEQVNNILEKDYIKYFTSKL